MHVYIYILLGSDCAGNTSSVRALGSLHFLEDSESEDLHFSRESSLALGLTQGAAVRSLGGGGVLLGRPPDLSFDSVDHKFRRVVKIPPLNWQTLNLICGESLSWE